MKTSPWHKPLFKSFENESHGVNQPRTDPLPKVWVQCCSPCSRKKFWRDHEGGGVVRVSAEPSEEGRQRGLRLVPKAEGVSCCMHFSTKTDSNESCPTEYLVYS